MPNCCDHTHRTAHSSDFDYRPFISQSPSSFPQVVGNPFAIVAQQFDIRPNPTTGLISSAVYGKDQILCGNVASTEWLVTEFKSSGQTARQPRQPLPAGIMLPIALAAPSLPEPFWFLPGCSLLARMQTQANYLSSGSEENCGGSTCEVGEGKERGLRLGLTYTQGLTRWIASQRLPPPSLRNLLSIPAQRQSRSDSAAMPTIPDSRRHVVEKARQVWIRKLIDLSRRNNLLYYRPLKTGTLDLSSAPAEILRELLVGESVPASKLLPDLEDEGINKSLRDISRRALENLEEKGLSTLFVTFGMATWPATDSGRPSEAPVLFLPVALSKREGSNSYHLCSTGAFQLNLALLHVLQDQFTLALQPEELLAEFAGDMDEGTVCDVKGLCEEIERRMSETTGFEIGFKTILGNFAFQKMAMVKDLQERASDLATHTVIAAIAGDGEAKTEINARQIDPDPKEFDSIPPENEFSVLDADSSQQSAIASVLSGQSRVIHGPPGTGKSQTITNLITNLAATGQRVLFVAEKKAALDVVKRRLEEVGLGHLAIVLHGADLSPRKVMQQVAQTLQVVRTAVPVDCRQVHAQLVDRRNRLNAHVARMHSLREPTRKSVFEMQGLILQLGGAVSTSTRWRGAELLRFAPPADRQIVDLLTEAAGFASLFMRTDPSPWTGAELPDGVAVQRALDLVQQMQSETLPGLLGSMKDVMRAGLRQPISTAEVGELADLLAGIQTTLSAYSPGIYTHDMEPLLRDLAPGRNGGFSAAWAWCSSGRYRHADRIELPD